MYANLNQLRNATQKNYPFPSSLGVVQWLWRRTCDQQISRKA